MAKLSANKKMVASTLQQLGISVSDSKLWDNTYLCMIGQQILQSSSMQNSFFAMLVNKIGKMYLTSNRYENQLKTFKKGTMPMGVAIEDIYINFQEGDDYDTESTLMTDEFKDDIISVYYVADSYKKFYAKTSYDAFVQAFVSWDNMDKFINGILSRLYDSQQLYEWKRTKQLLGNDFNETTGAMKRYEFNFYPNTFAQDLTKLLRATALNMVCPSATYNNFQEYAIANGYDNVTTQPVTTFSSFNSLNLIVRNDCLADVDVDVLSMAFNINKVEFLGKVHGVDNFGITENETSADSKKTYTKLYDYKKKNKQTSETETHSVYDITNYNIEENGSTFNIRLVAVICDDSFIHIEDTKEPMVAEFFDASNLIRTTYLHSWQLYGLCPFANALAIYTKTLVK